MALRLPGFGARVTAIVAAKMASGRITQKTLAQRWGTDSSNITNWKAGVLPNDYATLEMLARQGSLTVAYLLVGDEAKVKEKEWKDRKVDTEPAGKPSVVRHR